MHPQEIVRTSPVVVLRKGNDPFLILRIWAENCEIYTSGKVKIKTAFYVSRVRKIISSKTQNARLLPRLARTQKGWLFVQLCRSPKTAPVQVRTGTE